MFYEENIFRGLCLEGVLLIFIFVLCYINGARTASTKQEWNVSMAVALWGRPCGEGVLQKRTSIIASCSTIGMEGGISPMVMFKCILTILDSRCHTLKASAKELQPWDRGIEEKAFETRWAGTRSNQRSSYDRLMT